MPPHGPGVSGGLHSHDPQYPDDDWNLYSMLDADKVIALNATRPDHAIGIFKPFVLRLNPTPEIISDADEELIVTVVFTSPCHIRKFMVIGGGNINQHPSVMKCFVNVDHIDFTNVSTYNPTQQFPLPVNSDGSVEIYTSTHLFKNVTSLTFHFPTNHGEIDQTIIKYIGMQGEHTHYRREAVHTMYEVLCNGQDIEQEQGSVANHAGHMH